MRTRSDLWYKENRPQHFDLHKKWLKDNPKYDLLKNAKRRSLQYNKECTITEDDIYIPEMCPVLNKPMIKNTRYAPSLDRIDNSLGYIPGNVEVMSKKANTMKSDASAEELERFARWVLKL